MSFNLKGKFFCQCLILSLVLPSVVSSAQQDESFGNYELRQISGKAYDLTYYISMSEKENAPLVYLIQGSGCDPVFSKANNKVRSSVFNAHKISSNRNISVLIIEKPHSGRLGKTRGNSVQHNCRSDFHEYFTAENWSRDISKVLNSVVKELAPKKVLVFGMSEGAGIASIVAKDNPQVTHVALSGGSGTTQAFDFVLFDYNRCFNRQECLEKTYANIKAINSDPESYTKFVWGHPYRRWSSFFKLSPVDNLLKANAKIYLTFGTADEATPSLSQELLAVRLTAANKDISFERINDGNHFLDAPGQRRYTGLDAAFDKTISWFLGS